MDQKDRNETQVVLDTERPVIYGAGRSPEKPPKRHGNGWKITGLALLCAICVGAGALGALSVKNGNTGTPEAGTVSGSLSSEKESEADASSGADSSVQPQSDTVLKVPTLTSVEDGTVMTAGQIYESSVNSVVGITTEGTTKNIFGQISSTASSGTGFIVSDDGYILTNNHVIADGTTYTVTLYSGESYPASVIGADPENDIAVLKISADGLTPVTLGNSDELTVGEDVAIIGNPLGELTYTMTRGIISATGRAIDTGDGAIEMFQIDAAVNAGNSGGPAFNMYGQVTGIVTAKYSSSSIEGLGFCIPINNAVEIANDLIQYGYVRGKVELGLELTDASAVYQYYIRLYGSRIKDQLLSYGAYITGVTSGSDAQNAGLQQGDIITSVNDTEVNTVDDYNAVMETYQPGDKITLSVFRNGVEQIINITLKEYVPDGVTPPSTDHFEL